MRALWIIIALTLATPALASAQDKPTPASAQETSPARQTRLTRYKLARAMEQSHQRAVELKARISALPEAITQAESATKQEASISGVIFLAYALQQDLKRQRTILEHEQQRAAVRATTQLIADTQTLIDALKPLRVQTAKGKPPAATSWERFVVVADKLIAQATALPSLLKAPRAPEASR